MAFSPAHMQKSAFAEFLVVRSTTGPDMPASSFCFAFAELPLVARDPVDRMLAYFKHFFRSTTWEQGYSLAISIGQAGARLTHSHERQYHYVLQSLTLWREIMVRKLCGEFPLVLDSLFMT
jgi:hypothetical protein